MVLLFLVVVAASCDLLVPLAGVTRKQSSASDSLDLPAPRADLLSLVAEVGNESGCRVQSVEKTMGYIMLQCGSMVGATLGASTEKTITGIASPDGKSLNLSLQIVGSYGSGSYEQAVQELANFKSKLQSKLTHI